MARLRSLDSRRTRRDEQRKVRIAADRRQRLLQIMAMLLVVASIAAVLLGLMARERSRRLTLESERAEVERKAHAEAETQAGAGPSPNETGRRPKKRKPPPSSNSFATCSAASIRRKPTRRTLPYAKCSTGPPERVGKDLNEQPQVEAAVRAVIGRTYLVLGLYPQAEPQLKGAVELGQKYAPEHALTIKAMNDLGVINLYTANFAAAEPIFLDVLKLREKVYGPESGDVADSLFNLSLVYYQLHKYDQAMSYGTRALELRKKLFGEESLQAASSLQYLALTQNDAGRCLEAEPLSRQSLQLREKLYPPDHFELGNSHSNLGLILRNEGKLDEAEQHFKAALAIFEKALAPDHPNVAMVMTNLASTYVTQKKYDLAKPLAEKAVAIQEKRLGPDHPDLAFGINALAFICDAKGDYAVAETLYNRAAAIDEKALGADHPYTLMFRFNSALTLKKRARYDEALKQFRPLLENFTRLGLKSEIVQTKIAIVETMVEAKQYEQVEPMAGQLYDEAMRLDTPELRAQYGSNALQLLVALYEGWDNPQPLQKYRKLLAATSQPSAATPTTSP